MSLINILNMNVLDNPAPFANPLQFEITFECTDSLEEDIEWRVIYVGSAESSSHDQVLDELLVGPVPIGINKFILQTDAPDPSLIPNNDILGITVILVTCSYKEQEFARVGYYVNNEYKPFEGYNEEEHGAPDLEKLDLTKVYRQIVADKPRVTRFPIQWAGDLKVASSSAMDGGQDENNTKDDTTMNMDQDEGDMMENQGENDAAVYSTPSKATNASSRQNIVSPDAYLKDVVMSM